MQKMDLTNAETAIIDAFENNKDLISRDIPQILAAREAAFSCFKKYGLPSRSLENWHYTDLRTKLISIPPFDLVNGGEHDTPFGSPLISNSVVLPLMNGHAVMVEENSSPESSSISCVPLRAFFDSGEIQLQEDFVADDVISQINTAFVRDGWKVVIADNGKQKSTFPPVIEIQNIQNGGQSHTYCDVTIEKNLQAMIIERQIGDDHSSFLSSIQSLHMAEGAKIDWIIIRERGILSSELHQFRATLEANACLNLYVLTIGANLLRQEIKIDLVGSGSDFQLRAINLLARQSHFDMNMNVRHLVESTSSTEIIRNVLTGESRGVFQGKIQVAKIAQKTDARMACNSLILSDKAEIDVKPELEIFADDVACGHGATVAEIDPDHLFYLMARGIPESQARSLLVEAFVNELLDDIDEGELRDGLEAILGLWFQKNL